MLFVQRSIQLFLDFARRAQNSSTEIVEMDDNVGWLKAQPGGGFVGHTHPDLAIGQCSGRFISNNLLLYIYDFIVVQNMHCAAISMREGHYRSLIAVSSGTCTAVKKSVAADDVPEANFHAIDIKAGQRLAGILYIQARDDIGTFSSLWSDVLAHRLGNEGYRQTAWHAAVAGIVDQMITPPFTSRVREHYICGKGTELLCELSVSSQDACARRSEIMMVCDGMAADLSAPLNIADLARYAGLSAGHLMRLFKAETGMTMRDYHVDLRLKRASILLTKSKARIQEIASSLGFADAAQFSKSFKRKFGQTPNSVRQNASNGG